MKRLLFFVMTLTVLCACNDNMCTISGTLTDPVDTVRLVSMTGELLDVAAVNNGQFTLKCEMNSETGVSVLRGVPSYEDPEEGYDPIALIPDTKKIKVAVTDGVTVVSGSPLSEELQEFQQWSMNTFFENLEKIMALVEADDTIGADKLNAEMSDQMASHCREVYLQHTKDALGVQALGMLLDWERDMDKEDFLALYEQGGNAVKENAEIGGYYEYLMSEPHDVVLTLLDSGEIVTEQANFDDYVGTGNYTLVDFWASRCGPCKAESPNVITVYEKYRDNGLVVIGVPVNDKREATEKALIDWGIHYPQVLDPSLTLSDRFGIKGIPHLILFAPDGSIVAEGLRGEEIDAAVEKVLQ